VLAGGQASRFEQVPPLTQALDRVVRMPGYALPQDDVSRRVVLGFDIGSTCSKALALDVEERRSVWEGNVDTLGDPVGAARRLAERFVDETGSRHAVHAVGATGSGREIVGSLMSTCYGAEPVFVLNEIAAHAEGALFFDDRVDTIFEIGGQDAKYIRLDAGRICDAAMNEACSAGTGSFISEQGAKFDGVSDVAQMGEVAMQADCGISLGQHCSVFMAEVIDEAVSAGVAQPPIVAGIYDSIIQNYLNRVKGNRSVGDHVFCQGTPFLSDALAAAVARQTGSRVVVPPNPSTIGALGIALLASKEIDAAALEPLDLRRFLGAVVDQKSTFVCKSTHGCSEPGNHCRIDRLTTIVAGKRKRFTWGGSCSLFDSGTHRRKLPDRAPDPFHERNALARQIIDSVSERRGLPVVAMTDEFSLKGLLPFFATFLHRLGFDVQVAADAGQTAIKRGIEASPVPFCAPMQMYQGVTSELIAEEPDYLLLPRLRELPRQKGEVHGVTCPIVQSSPDVVRKLAGDTKTRLLTPRIDMGEESLDSERFRESTRAIARELGAEARFDEAFRSGCREQQRFDVARFALGRRALAFAAERDLVPVVVLGRPYTIYNKVLNSNVPALLAEQGALAIPVDCYPVDDDVPVFHDVYWTHSQVNLRAAHQIRRSDGVYAVFCSNYSCGPDSFTLHFFSYMMENKPFAVIETDGHSGDAGTKTRIEAFLYCVEGDRRLSREERTRLRRTDFQAIEADKINLEDAKHREDLVLIPRMGQCAESLEAMLRAEGYRAEALPVPSRDSLRLGRSYTSGKECVPMTITMGSLLERAERDRDSDERFAFFMPTANGPCRFGVYNLLHKILLEKAGWKERVRIVSPTDEDYFAGLPADFRIRTFVGFVATDLLVSALHDVRPVEVEPGRAQAIFDRYYGELRSLLEASRARTVMGALAELPHGMFGVYDVVRRAADEFASARDFGRDVPTVALVGEIYVRLDPFANDFVADRLLERGIRAMPSPFNEWLEYTTFNEKQRIREGRGLTDDSMASASFNYALQGGATDRLYAAMASKLGWGPRTAVEDAVAAADPYVSAELYGEAFLTVGGPVHEHEEGSIDGVVSVGPHECMPNKVAEAQFTHVSEETGLIALTLPLNGDPVDPELIDRFAFEVQQRYARRNGDGSGQRRAPFGWSRLRSGAVVQQLQGRALLSAFKLAAPFTRPRQGA
jgi:predicted CoA-substrate-specific enzyme activase